MGATASNAKNGSKRGGKPAKSSNWRGFCNIVLSSADQDRLSSETWAEADILAFLEDVTEDSYKFSMVADHEHGCVIASLTGKQGQDVNDGLTLSARGPNCVDAMRVLWYKHSVLADKGPWEAISQTPYQSQYG